VKFVGNFALLIRKNRVLTIEDLATK